MYRGFCHLQEELDVVFGMNLVHGRRDEEKADTASQEAKANEARE